MRPDRNPQAEEDVESLDAYTENHQIASRSAAIQRAQELGRTSADKAVDAPASAGIEVVASRELLMQRLDQDQSGQLGKFCRALSDSGVNIEVLYSDHDNQLVVAVDELEVARPISEAWGSGVSEQQ